MSTKRCLTRIEWLQTHSKINGAASPGVIRFDRHDATQDVVSLFATACTLSRLFDSTRAAIEERLLSGEVIETHWFTYRMETK